MRGATGVSPTNRKLLAQRGAADDALAAGGGESLVEQ